MRASHCGNRRLVSSGVRTEGPQIPPSFPGRPRGLQGTRTQAEELREGAGVRRWGGSLRSSPSLRREALQTAAPPAAEAAGAGGARPSAPPGGARPLRQAALKRPGGARPPPRAPEAEAPGEHTAGPACRRHPAGQSGPGEKGAEPSRGRRQKGVCFTKPSAGNCLEDEGSLTFCKGQVCLG